MQKRDLRLNTTLAEARMKDVERMVLTTCETVDLGTAMREGTKASESVHKAAMKRSSSRGW